ncbi:TPA: Gfo/Idh/MocA family oxidoreductase [Candidatus Bathyarchaeota archaeon]|nr:Gfo/Idh/MocA family oxidoreductase [Candidatus Bathyarchaeota archaeon]
MARVGMAFAGAGFLADMFARCYKEIPNVNLVAVFSRTEQRAKSFAEKYGVQSYYTDYEEMLKRNDIDAVNICVPNYVHASMTILAAEYGKHVLCTKPLAISMGQADEMVRACEKAGVKFMYGENWLYTPASYRLREIIQEGALGRILAIEAREQHSGSHSPYALKKRFSGGGVLIHMAVHPIGFIMHMIGKPVKRVYAEMGNLLHDIEGEDYAVMLMRFEEGESGIAQSNYITKGGMQDRIEIYGSEGMAFMNLTHANPITLYSDVGYSYVVEKASMSKGWTSPVIDERYQYGFANMVRHFVECIVEDKEPLSTGSFGREVLRVIFAGYESHEKKKAVNL